MVTDRSWMLRRKDSRGLVSEEFRDGVDLFLAFIKAHPEVMDSLGQVPCPCSKCRNFTRIALNPMCRHLYSNGFVDNYFNWTVHGEIRWGDGSSSACLDVNEEENSNQYVDMVMEAFGDRFNSNDPVVEEEPNPTASKFYKLLGDADEPLWDGCEKHRTKQTVLSAVAKLLNLKSEFNMSISCYDRMMAIIRSMMPDSERLPENYYYTRRMVAEMGLGYQKIDACINHCMLYYGDDIDKRVCPTCNEPRFKERQPQSSSKKEIPCVQLRYFPIIPRLQRLYMSKKTAEHMRWHSNGVREDESLITHPSDAEAWQHFNRTYPEFSNECRNVRLGLCTDGFNPHGGSSTNYSCWPVFLTPYNLPPSMCMRREYIYLTLLVPGPFSPGKSIDVYLRPLIDELKVLWADGVLTFDSWRKQNFVMRAALMWTINDFPAYGMLSGWSTHGKLACPYCMEHTKSFSLAVSHKCSWFDSHRQFLPLEHPFRRDKNSFFKGRVEKSLPPEQYTGEQLREIVNKLPTVKFGRNVKENFPGYGRQHHWTKRSIFWELPYWSTNLIRHNLDVMHVERNVFENIFNTVMDIKGKTKDTVNARDDLKEHCKRPALELVDEDGKLTKPKASYVLNRNEIKVVCGWAKKLKFPDGYASRIGRCFNMEDGKVYGMKSHDCHVFMQRLLPLAFREMLPTPIWGVITEIACFFRELCATKLDPFTMEIAEGSIVETICKLEKNFPPAFFDSMEHLVIHLPYEAKVGGPVQYRWMYPFERCMLFLKRKVKNKARVEGSIAEAYIIEEISNFTSLYFEPSVQTRHTAVPRNDDGGESISHRRLSIFKHACHPLGRAQIRDLKDDLHILETYVLVNCPEVEPYVMQFEDSVRQANPMIDDDGIAQARDNYFCTWFKELVKIGGVQDELIKVLSYGPTTTIAKSYSGILINGYRFHTKSYGKDKSTMCSGVCVKASIYGDDDLDYYGVVEEVLQVSYTGFACDVYILRCQWFNPTPGSGVRVNTYGYVDINHRLRLNYNEPFILASQAQQVYYLTYPHTGSRGSEWWGASTVHTKLFDLEKYKHGNDSEVVENAEEQFYQEERCPRSHGLVVENEHFPLVDIHAEMEVVDRRERNKRKPIDVGEEDEVDSVDGDYDIGEEDDVDVDYMSNSDDNY